MSYSVNEIIAYSHDDDDEIERKKKEHHDIYMWENIFHFFYAYLLIK